MIYVTPPTLLHRELSREKPLSPNDHRVYTENEFFFSLNNFQNNLRFEGSFFNECRNAGKVIFFFVRRVRILRLASRRSIDVKSIH